eukprot:scaffold123728_cov43-Attheya_sp.AAC.1
MPPPNTSTLPPSMPWTLPCETDSVRDIGMPDDVPLAEQTHYRYYTWQPTTSPTSPPATSSSSYSLTGSKLSFQDLDLCDALF